MTFALEATNLGKSYGRHEALIDCNIKIPMGRVVGLVGPNGAGKSTLLGLACGLLEPTTGSVTVLGERPGTSAAQLSRVGFVAQDTPLYPDLTVGEHLRLGAKLNPRWDSRMAEERVRQLNLDLKRKAARLSGGQRAQLALTIAGAKRPELLIFDEPVAALDPLARRAFLQNLMELVADLELTVVLSSHLLSDLERVCDYLVVLAQGRVQLAGPVEDLLASHYRLIGGREELDSLPPGTEVIQAEHTGRQSTLTIHAPSPPPASATVQAQRLDLEDMVLAYMGRAARAAGEGWSTPDPSTPEPVS
ncbi:ABC transporter ATP-binding protein [Phytohabitans houttuyneae]|uniref:ABC transporter ATP-binding protein n=1 Tax=Phytohabitans houttuyneae TaxID=1076126 RepID=A0A6V8K6X5_9ACTN|nr:ABC transporter ATP-binding protein [Phytohabitans houttuyneae]GFJ77869.1 ABC transporter ATP-binding protein [Phytohabitans houttuyneae]